MYRLAKRAFDLAAAATTLAVLSPLFLVIAVWIKLSSQGPVFYKGQRVGRGGAAFGMLKFRTMIAGAEKLGVSSTADDDQRITRPGRLLRRFKLDELPQLINVVCGQMSLVGPRPQVAWAVDMYSAEERKLLSVRPGITDFASLRFRNEGEILRGSADPDGDYLKKIAPGKIQLGLQYVRDCSFRTDISILAATALCLAGVDPEWCIPQSSQDESTPVYTRAAN